MNEHEFYVNPMIEALKEQYDYSKRAFDNIVDRFNKATTLLDKQVELVHIQREAKRMDRLLRQIKFIEKSKEMKEEES